MAITRTYETEAECARCWIREDFDRIPERLVLGQEGFAERYRFDSAGGEDGWGEPPMWATYFAPREQLDADWIEANAAAVEELGFTVIYEDGEVFALGIDGAGYDFYEAHWVPLYRLRGFRWHEG